ncbi:MAG: hypothetical protein OXG44_17335 [Gammaproteobacteria bacterium]|nr:hypothetical protein [Gammaproteobacteria bacterium]
MTRQERIGTAISANGTIRAIRRKTVGGLGWGVAARAAGFASSDRVRPGFATNAQIIEDFAEANPGVEVITR